MREREVPGLLSGTFFVKFISTSLDVSTSGFRAAYEDLHAYRSES